MIGLHQMSYSPAAAAAAAGAQNSSHPAGRKSSKAGLRQKQHISAQQQQFYEYEDHEQDMRRHEQYHRFDSTLEYDQRVRHSGAKSSAQSANIVRVPAHTANPIVVDSLVECSGRKPRSSSRRREPIEQQSIHYDAKEYAGATSSSSNQETRHFLLQQALEQSSRDNQQVLLIMSDHNSKSAGVPVIGRRLPSKSFGPPPGAKPVLVQELPPAVTQAIIMQHQQRQQQQQHHQAPVIGRRSHRMLKQQLEGANYSQQLALKCPSLSVLNSPESQLEAQQQQQHKQQLVRRHASGSSNKRLVSKRKSAAQIERRASNSCSSLCAAAPSPICLESCCQPAPVELLRCHANYAEPQPLSVATTSSPAASACLLPCCYPSPSGGERLSRRQPQVRSSSQSASRRSHHMEQTQHHYHHSSSKVNSHSSHKSSQSGCSSQRRHRHGANQGPPVPNKPTLPSYLAESLDENEHVTQMYESLAAELKAKLGNPNRAPILLPPKDYDTLSRQQGKLTGIELRRSTNPQLVGPAAPAAASTAATTKTTPNNNNNNNNCQQSSPSTTTGCSMSDEQQSNSPTSLSPTQSRHCASTVGEPSSSRSSGRGSETNASSELHPVNSLQRSRSNSSSGLGSISLGARSPSSAGSPESPTSKASSSEDIGRQLFHNERRRHLQQEAQEVAAAATHNLSDQHETSNGGEDHDDERRGKGIENHNPSKVSNGILWNGRVEIPLKVNSERRNGNTYLATKQIIY